MLEGKEALLNACRKRNMRVCETPINLLESDVQAEGNLDGMEVALEMNVISGMPGESRGTLTFQGNLSSLLAVLARVWPVPPEQDEAVSPGRQSWPAPPRKVGKDTPPM
ncbi:hypothetical protein [Symbiobacterium thermophilum]|uniref:Uncharacterized protein n=1 Tax=Symbiobacterium thermophilum (strain DSM 24528 / JCM 14929 / IAM 14863 / T) TaxID=292459 RepID=Q67SX5_SYMTH|nr:hypothetical protein [Symbiobacterium thermophilum]BAD39218.1 hypothetical protein STH233 [Symbiobacterium thermophilum IAM 14863]